MLTRSQHVERRIGVLKTEGEGGDEEMVQVRRSQAAPRWQPASSRLPVAQPAAASPHTRPKMWGASNSMHIAISAAPRRVLAAHLGCGHRAPLLGALAGVGHGVTPAKVPRQEYPSATEPRIAAPGCATQKVVSIIQPGTAACMRGCPKRPHCLACRGPPWSLAFLACCSR